MLSGFFVVTSGRIEAENGDSAPQVFGENSVLFRLPLALGLRASAEGATCLVISRANFFTLINESPGFAMGLLERDDVAVVASDEGFGR